MYSLYCTREERYLIKNVPLSKIFIAYKRHKLDIDESTKEFRDCNDTHKQMVMIIFDHYKIEYKKKRKNKKKNSMKTISATLSAFVQLKIETITLIKTKLNNAKDKTITVRNGDPFKHSFVRSLSLNEQGRVIALLGDYTTVEVDQCDHNDLYSILKTLARIGI